MDLTHAAELIQSFDRGSLTKQISKIEKDLVENKSSQANKALLDFNVRPEILDAALAFKKAAGQINVIVHALGILLSLPYLLEKDEVIQALSLGAGNTGKPFDLETDRRIADYKFIQWQGGPEVIRQNQLFKDYLLLAEYDTHKKKYLYVLGKSVPLKFLKSGRALSSIMSRNRKIDQMFHQLYGNRFTQVNEYYQFRQNEVEIVDLIDVLPSEIGQLFEN